MGWNDGGLAWGVRRASDIVSRVRISDLYRALGGSDLRRGRGRAFWRDGDGYNVRFDDAKGTWYDYVAAEGGGVLDLVVRVRGGNRADALRWCADLAGVPLDDQLLTAEDRARWAAQRRELKRELPEARYWRRAAVSMAEELLDGLKAALVDPTLPEPRIAEIGEIDGMLGRLSRTDGAALVAEYHWWREHYPGMTAGMVRAAKAREQSEWRALVTYLRLSDPQRSAA